MVRMWRHEGVLLMHGATTGFSDQSHLHRHFRRGLDFTPGEYAARFRR